MITIIVLMDRVEGVKTAPIIVETKITYRQEANICLADTIFNNPNKI